jgi:hypothetical protein
MEKVLALFQVFRKGQSVANPEAWKKGQVTGSVVAGLLGAFVAAAKAFGYPLPVSDDQLLAIGSGIVAVMGLFLNPAVTVASSDKVGLPSRNEVINKPFSLFR